MRMASHLTMLPVYASLVLAFAAPTYADPPQALPQNAEPDELKYQPAFDYDRSGCYPTPAIGLDGTIAPGLTLGGWPNSQCHDRSDLNNTNSYSRYKCNNGWCAYMYALYFEKDQASFALTWPHFSRPLLPAKLIGHRHDWEHLVVWVEPANKNPIRYVAVSARGSFKVQPSSKVQFDQAGHPKVVYQKDGFIGLHSFRLATWWDRRPDNDYHTWQFPALVGWNGYPEGLRDNLTSADFGKASLGIKDGTSTDGFVSNLNKAKPAGIPFDASA